MKSIEDHIEYDRKIVDDHSKSAIRRHAKRCMSWRSM